MATVADLMLRVDSSQARTARGDLRQLTEQGGRTEKSVRGVGAASAVAGKGIGVLAAGVAGAAASMFALGSAVGTLARFDDRMAQVAGVTGAAEGELAQLHDTAQELGSTTSFSASEAADGMRFLAMAGYDTNEIMSALPDTLNLARTAGIGLGQAADTASNILSGFGLQASETTRVVDVLASTSTSANTSVGQLGQAMSEVAPVARSLGIEIEDASAAIGILGDSGIQGSRAGTGLRNVLVSLLNPTGQAKDAMKALGLSMDDFAINSTQDLYDVLNTLGDAGVSATTATQLFGREAQAAGLTLIEAADRGSSFSDMLQDVDGAAQDLADTFADSLQGDFDAMGSAIEGLILAIGDSGLTSAIRQLVQTGTAGIRLLTDNLERAAYYAGTFAAVFTAQAIPAVAGLIASVGGLTGALTLLRGAMVRIGFGALVVAAGELVYQFSRLVDVTGGFGEALTSVGDIAADVWDRLGAGADFVSYKLTQMASQANAAFVEALGNMAGKWIEFTWAVADGMNNLFGTNFSGADATITQELQGAFLDAEEAAKNAGDAAQYAYYRFRSPLQSVKELREQIAAAGADGESASNRLADAMENAPGLTGGGGLATSLDDDSGSGSSKRDKEAEAIERVIEGLRNEIELVGLSNEARRTQQALHRAGVDLYSEEGQQIAGMVEELSHLERVDNMANGLNSTLSDLILNTSDWRDTMTNALDNIASKLVNSGIDGMLSGMFDDAQKGGLLDSVGSLLSFDGGGHTGSRPRSGGIDGKGGFPAILHPQETVIDHSRGQQAGGRVQVELVSDGLTLSDNGSVMGRVDARVRQSEAQTRRDMPNQVRQTMRQDRNQGRR